MSLRPKDFESAKAAFKPMKRGRIASVSPREPGTLNPSRKGISRSGKPLGAKKKAKRAKMPTRKSLVRKADNLVSLIIRLRDGKCVECGSVEKLTNGHVLGRRSFATRFDITPDGDCHCQCWGCNFKACYTAAVSYHAWYVRTFGAEAFDALYRRWAAGKKWSRPELMELIASLKIQLAGMEN